MAEAISVSTRAWPSTISITMMKDVSGACVTAARKHAMPMAINAGASSMRPVNSATTKELILNFGQTAEVARKATTPPIVIYTRPAGSPAGAMPSLILRVHDLDKALEAVKANGGTLVRAANRNAVMNLTYAMVKDPDGNQIELIMDGK